MISNSVDDSYWRLSSYGAATKVEVGNKLRDAGYYCPKSWCWQKTGVVAYAKATSRPEYRYLEHEELVKFVTDRGIDLQNPEEATEPELWDSLLAADAKPVFEKLEELPAELRGCIYEYYFCDFRESLHRPTQPPLARLSRLMRAEVLPLFYKTCRFEIHFHLTKPKHGSSRCRVKIDPASLLFLLNMRAEDLALMRRLKLVFDSKHYGKLDYAVAWGRVDVNMPGVDTPVEISSVPNLGRLWLHGSKSHHIPPSAGIDRYQERVMAEIREAVRTVLDPVKQYELKVADLLRLLPPIEAILTATAERYKPRNWQLVP